MTFLSPFDFLLWLVWALFLCLLIQPSRKTPFLAVYVAFSGVRTLLLGVSAIGGSLTLYWTIYWPLQGVGYTLSMLLAISLLVPNVRRPIGALLLILGPLLVVLPFVVCLGAMSWEPWLLTARWADAAILWVLIAYLAFGKQWKQPQEGLAWGLALGSGGHVLCAMIQGDHDPVLWLRLCYQISGCVQLGVWYWALRAKPHNSPMEMAAGMFH